MNYKRGMHLLSKKLIIMEMYYGLRNIFESGSFSILY